MVSTLEQMQVPNGNKIDQIITAINNREPNKRKQKFATVTYGPSATMCVWSILSYLISSIIMASHIYSIVGKLFH